MEMVFCVYAVVTLALLVMQLVDYVVGPERVPLIKHTMLAPVAGPPGLVSGSASEPRVQYRRAA
jgi:hypothetical protein